MIFISCSNSTTSAAGSGGRLEDNFPKQPRTELKIPPKAAAILGPKKQGGEDCFKMEKKKGGAKSYQMRAQIQLSTLGKGDDFQIWSQSIRPSCSSASRLPFPMASRISLINHHQGSPSPGLPPVLWCYFGYPTGGAWAWQSAKGAGKCEWSLALKISKLSEEWMVFSVFSVTPTNQEIDGIPVIYVQKLLPPSLHHRQSPH